MIESFFKDNNYFISYNNFTYKIEKQLIKKNNINIDNYKSFFTLNFLFEIINLKIKKTIIKLTKNLKSEKFIYYKLKEITNIERLINENIELYKKKNLINDRLLSKLIINQKKIFTVKFLLRNV